MNVDWGALVTVAVVSAAVSLVVVSLVSFALVALTARARPPAGDRRTAPLSLRRGTGTAVAAVCLLAAALIVGYGLFLIVA
jgi:hypothetical protein